MHGLLRCNINIGVHAYARAERSGRVTQSCHNSPDGKRGYRVRVTSRTGSAWRFLGDFEKVRELSPVSEEDGWLSLARGGLGQVSHEMGGGRWKSQNRKNVYLSPYVEEPLNSKVIESFVPEQRSRYVIFEFRDSYVLSLGTFDARFTHSRIWLWNMDTTIQWEGDFCFLVFIVKWKTCRNSFFLTWK